MSAPAAEIGGVSSLQRLLSIFSMVRYRFFLYAGLLPYLLGSAWGYATSGALDVRIFLSGLGGVVLSVIGVEAFNEYFDSRMGTDRVFNPEDLPPMSSWVLWLGIGAFAAALAVGVYLTLRGGWPIFAFALAGGMAAIFYVAPPIRWAYRGLGELVIALSYGPWMVLGSVYLYTRAAFVGRAHSFAGAGPPHHGTRGSQCHPRFSPGPARWKAQPRCQARPRARGTAVRGACRGGARCCAHRRRLRPVSPATLAALLALPLLVSSARSAIHTFETPRLFVPAIRSIVRCYLAALLLFIGGILLSASTVARMNAQINRLRGPLLVSWQITRDCDLACLHCCTDSAPGKRLPGELTAAEAMKLADDIIRCEVPYVMLCGGEPLVVPHFMDLAESLGRAGVLLKIETNGQRFDAAIAERLARLPVRSVQISLDADTQETYGRQRPGGSLAKVHAACRAARAAGLPLEVTFASTRLNLHEADAVIERARILGAFRFNTGKLMRIGTAARLWGKLEPTAAEYTQFRATLDRQSVRVGSEMELCYSPFEMNEALRQNLTEPPATLLVLPTGWVKVAAALPHICADLRRDTIAEAWAAYRKAWASDAVSAAIRRAIGDESLHAEANLWNSMSTVQVGTKSMERT